MVLMRRSNINADAAREIKGLFADDSALDAGREWAVQTLEAAGLDPRREPIKGIHALRKANRRLSLVAARYLVDRAAGRPVKKAKEGPGAAIAD